MGRWWWWQLVALLALVGGARGSVNCRVACRECREGREARELLTVYCAMCEECKDRRREREWLIARKQDLEKEAELRKSSTSPVLRHGGLRSSSRHECPTPPPCEEERHQCPPCPAPVYAPFSLPYSCPTPPPCEEETTTPRPTCPPIPPCVKMQRWTPQVYYEPRPPPPTAPACSPCPNMCPCPGTGTESVFIGVPDQLLQT